MTKEKIDEELPGIVNDYDFKLIWSGYAREERVKIIESDLIEYLNRIANLKKRGGNPYLQAHQTLEQRLKKKLLEKNNMVYILGQEGRQEKDLGLQKRDQRGEVPED